MSHTLFTHGVSQMEMLVEVFFVVGGTAEMIAGAA